MVISGTVIIVMFILLVVSIMGNAFFIGLYVSEQNSERIVKYERRQQEFDEQKGRVEKTLHDSRH